MKIGFRLSRVHALCGVAMVSVVASAQAQAQSAMRFHIAPQALGSALRAFGLQSGMTVVADDFLTRDKVSVGYKAVSDPETALRALLRGTGLTIRRRGKIFLVGTDTVAAVEPPQTQQQEAVPGDIVVTAQKRAERIQDVPIAISAFTQETLDKQKIEGGPDLLKAVPNLTFSKSNFAGYNLEIRGIGTKAISVTTDPGVAVNFNSTTLITNRFFEQEFFDIERIEVLRGPQGTLYGRNATGGVVNIISNKADLTKFDGYLKAEVGNFGSRRAQGAINIPIVTDVLGLRLAGAYTNRDGFTTNDITMNRIDGRDLYTTRATLSFKATSDIRSDLVWERFSENDNRARTAKQLCHRDPGPTSIASLTSPTVDQRGLLSQGCKDGSLYDDEAYGVPNGLSLPYVTLSQAKELSYLGNTADGTLVPLLKSGVDPYADVTQTHDLRRISSITDPKYRAKSNVFEWNSTWDISDRIAITAQSAYNRDRYYSTQDYNRFNTAPIFNSTDGLITNDPRTGAVVPAPLVEARSSWENCLA